MRIKIYDKRPSYLFKAFLLVVAVLSVTALQAQLESTVFDTAGLDSLRSATVEVAYGRQSYDAVTGSMETVYGADLLKRNTTSFPRALAGQLPGLHVRNLSGMPGADVELTIRGYGTYNSTMPLILVDGFRTDYEHLSLYEIESVSVLKDAAATVLYGMEAANGVILITTKRGVKGPLAVQANVQYGVQQMTKTPKLLNAAQYATYYNQALQNDGLPLLYEPVNDIPNYGKGGDYRYTHPDNDYFGEFLRNLSPMMNAGVNLTGGNDIAQYNATVSYLGNSAAFARAHLNDYSTQMRQDRVNIRTNLDVNLFRGFRAAVGAAVTFDNNNYPGVAPSSILDAMMSLAPQAFPITNPDGSYGGTSVYRNNPLGMISGSGYQSSLRRNVDVNLRIGYDFDGILEGLSMEAAGAIATTMTIWDNKVKQFEVYSIDDPANLAGTTYTRHGSETDLAWATDVLSYKRFSFEPTVSYARSWDEHSMKVMVMGHMDRYTQNINSIPYNFDNAGVGARLAYSYDGKYFGEFGAGYYGQEQYRKGNRFLLYPSVSAGWVISNEDFLVNSTTVQYLKMRSSYGIVGGGSGLLYPGNTSTSRLFYNQYYQKAGSPTWGENNSYNPATASYLLGALANPDITADKSFKFNFGIEGTFLDHVDAKADFFTSRRIGILTSNQSIPHTMGFAGRSGYVNGGEVKNHGYEFSLRYFGTAGDFGYSIHGSVSYSKSKLVKKPDVVPLHGVDNRSGIGMPVGQNFGYRVVGFYESDEAAMNAKVVQTFGPVQAGDAIYRDYTGDDFIDISDMVALGYSFLPRYEYTVGVDLKYKNISLSVTGQGIAKSSIMLGGNVIPFTTQGNAFVEIVEKSWSPDNKARARYPRLSTAEVVNNSQSSSAWLFSRDYFKLRNVEVGYDFSFDAMRKIGLSSARVYIMGTDIFTHAKELNILDPESLSIYPPMKSYSIGLQLNF